LWDTIGIQRAHSIVADSASSVGRLGCMVDRGGGVVEACQPLGGGPTAGGDGIHWWRSGVLDPQGCDAAGRVRLMPLLEGLPVRLHGIVLSDSMVAFPPMEIVALPRVDRGTFLCAGAVRTLRDIADLVRATDHVGRRLGDRLGYRGGFSVDGIYTADGFLPTDFNARLTSAIESAPCDLRVRLHLANLLARDDAEVAANAVQALADQIFAEPAWHTLYGAATRVALDGPREAAVRWHARRLATTTSGDADGHLGLRPSPRGWLLTARLTAVRLPVPGPLGLLAPEVFRLSDDVFGTDFGELEPPFGATPAA
jgi:hypothetical protein